MTFQTINPYTEEILSTFPLATASEQETVLQALSDGYHEAKAQSLSDRLERIEKLSGLLEADKAALAKLMATEMGKPVSQGITEVEKCALLCRYYAEEAPKLLTAAEAEVRIDPLGVIVGIMPWNYPFWQVFRFAIPVLAVGNTVLIKHAPNVPQCALKIRELMAQAGIAPDYFDTLFLSNTQVASVIGDRRVSGVSLTGSAKAGSAVAEVAGRHLKKVILELGGSDPFIVCEDADATLAAQTAVMARCSNAGQTCISAKRFFVHRTHYEPFLKAFVEGVKGLVIGDPLKEDTTLGPLARVDLRDNLARQVAESVSKGAEIQCGGSAGSQKAGFFYSPTVLTNLTPDMPVLSEETFGPVAAVVPFESDEEALRLANQTQYGLAASVWTRSDERGSWFSERLESGSVFVNDMVKSIPHLPFGGVKSSGFGRELGREGLVSFANVKTVVKR